MSRSTTHPLQPQTDAVGISRRLAVLACKRAIRSVLEQGLKRDFEADLAGDINTGGSKTDTAIEQLPAYRSWASATRAAQDRMWHLLAEQIDADYPRIASLAGNQADGPAGSLQLDPGMRMPAYMTNTHIHGQPGGYLLDRGEDDLAAGILYEAGGNLYAMGQGIGRHDSKAERLIQYIRDSLPEFSPGRILEMGCSAGGQSADYPLAFPDAEFHALDLSAAMLRFAHLRAEALGAVVHFHQADAAATPFPDGYFDLVISHNLFHEVSAAHMPAIVQECFRLLAPGGVCLHQDIPIQTERLDRWMRFVSEWQKDHNDEPFWLDFANADLPGLMVQAGFEKEMVSATYLKAIDGPIPWYVVMARKMG